MSASILSRASEPGGRLAGRVIYPLGLVRARLVRRLGRVALVGAGIAAGAAVLALVDGGGAIIRDRGLERAVVELPASDRVVQATWFGTIGTGANAWKAMDAAVRPQLRALTGTEPVAAMLYREAQIGGRLVDLRAADGIARYVHLRSGRLPRPCRPTHCEVLRLAGTGPLASAPSLRLVQVGTATLDSDAPFGDFLGRVATDTSVLSRAIRYHAPPQAPLVLAEGVEGLSRTPELATFYRSYAWFVPVSPASVHPWSVERLRARVDRLRSTIGTSAAGADAFDVTAPTQELAAAAAQGDVSARRLLLLGGEAAALLLAFVLLAASSLRRDAEAARRRLSWFGARRWQLALFSTAESGAVAAAATLAGWAAGAGLVLLVASRAGSPAVETLRHSAGSGSGIALALGTAVAAAVLLVAALRAPARRAGGPRLTPLDVAALGALLAIVVGLARGGADASSLAAGDGTFLLLLPGLVAFVAAVACMRLLAPLLRALERAGRRGPLPLRLAAVSLARNPGRSAVAVAFLVVSLGLALFAAAYRSTLTTGQRDQADYAVPADFVLSEDLGKLVSVSSVPRPPGDAIPVLRATGGVSRLETSNGADVLGIPADALTRIDGWRPDFAPQPLGALAAAIRPDAPTSLRTLPVRPGARTLELDLAAHGDPVLVRASVRLAGGDFASVRLGETPEYGPAHLEARLPAGTRAVLGLTFELLTGGRGAANGGIGAQPTANGTLTLRTIRADGRGLMPDDWTRWTPVGSVASRGPGRVAYALTPDVDSGFRLRQPTDGRPLAAIVTPALAAAAGTDGLLPFEIAGERVVLRVAGVATRFPGTTQPDFVVVDESALSTELDALAPGVGRPNETWLNVPPGQRAATARTLAEPPLDQLEVHSQAALESQLRGDPLARGVLYVLAGTALVALALAAAGLLLGLLADLRDERGELFDLETQGASPALLRRHLRLRTLLVAAAGTAGGIATGAVLAALVLDLVRLTAGASNAQPPLVFSLDLPLVLAGAGVWVAVAAVAVAAVTRLGSRSAGRIREAGA
ncbi:MAG TPA: hypothetical protein VFI37_10770 [Gaiellaceae bacterium]|nr:hypothetical protein [Gaiellaceae bacterium]